MQFTKGINGDEQHDVSQLDKIIDPLDSGICDIVLGQNISERRVFNLSIESSHRIL